MTKLFLGVLALALVAGLSGCRGHEAGARSAWMTSMVAHKLDLTADQKAKGAWLLLVPHRGTKRSQAPSSLLLSRLG